MFRGAHGWGRTNPWRRAAVVGTVAALLVGPHPSEAMARSNTSATCAAAAERGQALRDEGKLGAAREAFAQCLRPECPKVIATECATWFDDVGARQPSVVVAVHDERGLDVVGATIRIDGAARDDAGKGRSVPLDPGPHTVETIVDGKPLSQRFVLREREKDRSVVLEPPRSKPPDSTPAPPPRFIEERPIPVVSYVLGGVAVVLGATGTVFGVSAASDYADLERTCPTGCTETDILGLRAKTVTADIAFSLGVVAAVGAVVVYLVRPTVLRPATSATTSPWLDVGRATLRF